MENGNYTVHLKLTKSEYEKLKKIAEKEIRTINNLLYKTLKEGGLI